MIDIKLCSDGDYSGDLDLTEDGDIQLGNSLLQNAKIAILGISGEWRLGPDFGLPWFDDILIKNPDIDLIRQEILDAILELDEVESASVEVLEYSSRDRTLSFSFSITADGETYEEEVTVSG